VSDPRPASDSADEGLKHARERWARAAAAEPHGPSPTTVEDRVRIFTWMYEAALPHLVETEPLFGPPRRRAMIALQARLRLATAR
jgi:hypothetical protein